MMEEELVVCRRPPRRGRDPSASRPAATDAVPVPDGAGHHLFLSDGRLLITGERGVAHCLQWLRVTTLSW